MTYETQMFSRGQTAQATAWLNGEGKDRPGVCVGIGGGVSGRYMLTKELGTPTARQTVHEARAPEDIDKALAAGTLVVMDAVADWSIVVVKHETAATKTTPDAKPDKKDEPKKKAPRRSSKKATEAAAASAESEVNA